MLRFTLNLKKIQSITLFVTIFIVFIVLLGIKFLISLSNLNMASNNQMVLGKIGVQAAKSGIEWALANVVKRNACFDPAVIDMHEVGFKGFKINITCNIVGARFKISSQAVYGIIGDIDYINKVINVQYPAEKIFELYNNNISRSN